MNVNDSKKPSETDWVKIEAMTDEEIDTSDIPPVDDAFFAKANLRMPKGKVPVVLSVDAEVVEWFKAQGNECHRLINDALRLYAEAHKEPPR